MNDTNEKKRAFAFKLGAAKYHLQQLRSIFKSHNQLFFEWSQKPESYTPKEIIPFFYYYDAFLYELVSCFDMILQYLAAKCNLQINDKTISWNNLEFKQELRRKCPNAFSKIESEYGEWWFEDLRTARNYIAHHDRPPLGLERNDKGITLLFFYIPGLHQGREMFEQCDFWGSNISKLFKSIEKVDN